MLVAWLHIFVSRMRVHLHLHLQQALDVCYHGRLTWSAFDVTCMMLFLYETWGASHTGPMCAVMITGMIVALMRCVLYSE